MCVVALVTAGISLSVSVELNQSSALTLNMAADLKDKVRRACEDSASERKQT